MSNDMKGEDGLLGAFRQCGFALRQCPDYLKLTRGRCEIHVRREPQGIGLAIPVVRLGADRQAAGPLESYLEERNRGHKGPGRFAVRDGLVWYEAKAGANGDTAAIALAMQETVERLGPRILNILG